MAKAGFWLKGATGKLAGSALQKGANGNTIMREIVKPKNPKTGQQTVQRVLMNTTIQAYSALKQICNHSFQGVETGQKSMSRFMKLNLDYFRRRASEVGADNINSYVNFSPIGEKGIRAGRFIIADGTLPTIPMTITDTVYNAAIALETNTYEAFINKYNLSRGDQVTLVTIEKHAIDQRMYAHFARIILDPRNADGTAAPLSSALIANGAINLPNESNSGNFTYLAFEDSKIQFCFSDGFVCSAGAIVSRKLGDEEMRSFCQMVLNEDAIANDAVSLTDAIALSRTGYPVDFEDDDLPYLDNSGTGGGQSSNSGQSSGSQSPVVAESVAITANGATVNQNVAGGSVTATAPITALKVSGVRLAAAELKAGTTNAVGSASPLTVNAAGTEATWSGNLAANGTLYVFKGGQLWFSLAAQGGDDDLPGQG